MINDYREPAEPSDELMELRCAYEEALEEIGRLRRIIAELEEIKG